MVRAAVATKAKKKPGDFKRPKRKVGRRAPQAANVTSVAIASRRINLLEQSVLQDKGDAAVTHRNLTLQDLLVQVAHYNAHVRQRALQGLRELAAQPSAASNLLANVAALLERFLPTFVDEEAVVRDAAVAAWKALLPVLIQGKSLSPFAPLVTVYMCSGMTHLQIGVRRDTLRAIAALLDHAPELVIIDAGLDNLGRLIENFKDLIGAAQAQGIKVNNSYNLLASSDNSSGKANAGKKAKAKKSGASGLALRFEGLKVLHNLLSSMNASASASSQPDSANVQVATRSSPVATTPTLLIYPPPSYATTRAQIDPNAQFWQEKSRTLLKPLLDLWLECLEDVSVETLGDDDVEHLHYMVECVGLIVDANVDHLVTLDKKQPLMKIVLRLHDELLVQRFPMFPSSTLVDGDLVTQARWYTMNVSLAKLACVFLSRMPSAPVPGRAELETHVHEFVISTLGKYRDTMDLRSLSGAQSLISNSLEVLAQLLSVGHLDSDAMDDDITRLDRNRSLLEAFTQFYTSCAPRSLLFRVCTTFVVKHLSASKPWPEWTVVLQWMRCFAKFLGHLESTYIDLGRQCLAAMISVLKQLPSEFATSEEMDAILTDLVAFFDLASSSQDATKRVTSQFDALPPHDQVNFVAVVYHLPRYPVLLVRALTSCCKSSSVCSDAKTFLMDILFQRREDVDLAHLVSFLMSSALSVTPTAGEMNISAYRQQLVIVRHVCRILLNMNLGSSLPKILAPALSRQSSDRSVLTQIQLHTLVLLYRACLVSATEAGSNVDTASTVDAMEQTLVLLVAQSFNELHESRLDKSIDMDTPLKLLEEDCILTLYSCDGMLFIRVLTELTNSAGSPLQSADSTQRSLRILQSLARSPSLTGLFARHRKVVTELVTSVESRPANGDITQLVRQLLGDLDLVAAGQA